MAPTPRQIAYAKDLGIRVTANMTYDQLSDRISGVLGRDQSGRFVKKQRPDVYATTQATGKTIKALVAVNWVAFVLGLVALFAGSRAGAQVVAMTVFAGFGLRICRWWNHG